VLENAVDAAERLDHVGAVVVQVPQLAVEAVVRPPERVAARDLVRLERQPDAPAARVRQRVPIFGKLCERNEEEEERRRVSE
jgi:hypothetical protein